MARSDKENKKFDSKFRVRVANGSGKLVSGDLNESDPVANILYVNTLPSEIVYNMADGTTQTVTIGRDADNNPIINGITYNRHIVDIPSGTVRYGEPPKTPPAIVDIILSGDVIGDDAPINAVIGTLTGVGGTPPIGFQLISGSPFVKVVGTELRVASDLSSAPSQITVEILAQDTANEQFSKQFNVSVIPSPAITDITLSNSEFTDTDPIGTVVGVLGIVGGTVPATFEVINDPNNIFDVDNINLITKGVGSVDDSPYSVTIRATDLNGKVFDKSFSITVNIGPFTSSLSTSFNGINQSFFVAGDNAFLNPNVSISFWIKPDQIARTAISYGDDLRILGTTSGSFDFRINGADGGGQRKEYRVSSSYIPANIWSHVALVYGAGSDLMQIFVNTVEVPYSVNRNNAFPNGRLRSASANLYIGSQVNSSYFSGKLDEVSWWRRALTGSDVVEIYTNDQLRLHSRYNNVTAWYKMGENNQLPLMFNEKSSNLNALGGNITPADITGDVK